MERLEKRWDLSINCKLQIINYKLVLKIIFIVIVSVIFTSCNKDTPPKQTSNDNPKTEITDEGDTDSTMTVEEIFSSALVQNILGDESDEDLQIYLEEIIYPLVSKSNKVTMDKISSSLYLLSYDENGVMKNYMIQKFYNPGKDEFVFEKKETQTDAVKQFGK